MKKLTKGLLFFAVVSFLQNGCTSPVEDGLPGSESDTSTYHSAGWQNNPLHGAEYQTNPQNCRACHGEDLEGGTSGISCGDCHHSGWSGTHGQAFAENPSNCGGCHGADLKGGLAGVSCASCHHSGWTGTHGQAFAESPHSCKGCHGQDLTGALSGISCADCHHSGWSGTHAQAFAEDPNNCKGCHGQNLRGALSGVSCISCHHSNPTTYQHGGTARHIVPENCDGCHGADLTGGHTSTSCKSSSCHPNRDKCAPCHKTLQSHPIHTVSNNRGPTPLACEDCHTVDPFNYAVLADGNNFANSTNCDACHSPNGAYDGASDAVIGAKSNWEIGVYDGDALRTEKERWCAACHDDQPANSQTGGMGVNAPNIVGNNTTYGFYVTGHNINCLSCHDASKNHIDHEHRTYTSASNNYQAGYRLKPVNGGAPMNIPRPKSTDDPHNYLDHFALCFDCHNADELIGESDEWDASKTNFDYSSGANGHYEHLSMGRITFDSDFDSVGDSDFTCTTCHNVHGSPTPAMTRHGELILATRNDLPPDFGALNFSYLPLGATVVTSVAGKIELAGGGVTQNGICAATCHGSGATVYRTAYSAPRVLSCPEIDPVFNDGVDTVLLTAYVLDHNAVTVPTVTIDVGPLDDSTETMHDDGINGGDEIAGDHIYSFETTVPDTVDAGPASLDVTATDGDGTGTNQVEVPVVDPEELVVDNEDAEYVGTWPLVTGNACAYEEDFQWNEAGSGADTATWTPTVYQAGDYNVYARWVAHANRATDAPYTITYDGGSVTIDKNQQTDGCTWNLLGTYPFEVGTAGSVVLSDDANGYLNADAVKLELQP
jgi:hypothetical protein